jgi:hypothetical protein
VARLAKEGLVEEESEGRFRITPLVEIVLSNERLGELREWLREQVRTGGQPDLTEPADDEPDETPAPAPEPDAADEAPDPGPTLEEAAALADDETETEEVAR